MPRSGRAQSKHNAEVRKVATDLKKKGYNVNADVRGFSRPDTIGGYRPDVVGRKGAERKIVEIETPDSVSSARDLAQQKAFREAAKRSKNTTFTRKVTK